MSIFYRPENILLELIHILKVKYKYQNEKYMNKIFQYYTLCTFSIYYYYLL